jgi:hypothetical protein
MALSPRLPAPPHSGFEDGPGTETRFYFPTDAMDTGRFSNFPVRATIGAGRSIVAGFVVEGARQKIVLVRGIGPGLASFGVVGVLPVPRSR